MWDDDVDWMSADKIDREETGRTLPSVVIDDAVGGVLGRYTADVARQDRWRLMEQLSAAITDGENTFSGDGE